MPSRTLSSVDRGNCPACQTSNDISTDTCVACGHSLSALPTGCLIASRYEIRDVLGQGGMGTVYAAHDQVLDEPVAIKVLKTSSRCGDLGEMVRRLRSEIKLARKVSHPNVCRIHDYGEDGDLIFISMALLEGSDLRMRLEELPRGLPPGEAFDVVIRIAEGLRAIHDVGIIHRDLKTANVMLDDDGHVHLMDFGIAKDSRQRLAPGITTVGMVVGTPEYMSPEQGRGLEFDRRSDIYSLGIVTFEIFTGDVPFRGDSMVATIYMHIHEPPPFDGPRGSRLPAAIVPVLRRALAKDADERYGSVAAMAEALREARAAWKGQGEPAPLPELSLTPVGAREEKTPGQPAVARRFSGRDRRRHERLAVPVDLVLSRLDESGRTVSEERTIAENVSLSGASVLTTMVDIGVADLVHIREVEGDFKTRAAVRQARKGTDKIFRVGVEFLDAQLPRRFLPADHATGPGPRARLGTTRPPTGASERSRAAAAPAEASSTPAPPAAAQLEGRRAHSRLKIIVDLILKRIDTTGREVQRERTIADQVSRGGMRILTSFSGMGEGDLVAIEEVGGDLEARAEVRHTYVGTDRVRRLGVKLLDCVVPDRLVPEDELTRGHTAARRRQAPAVTSRAAALAAGSANPWTRGGRSR